MKKIFWLTFVLLLVSSYGCGWVRSLREEVEDDTPPQPPTAAQALAALAEKGPQRGSMMRPPPPATVADASRGAIVAGTPVDLSGTRAKSGRVTKQDFLTEGMRNENSLWAEDGQNNYLFARNKLKMPGDLISVILEDDLRKDMINAVRKLLPAELRDQDIKVPGLTKTTGSSSESTRAVAQEGGSTGDLSADDTITAEVLERYPNGNVRIRGMKRVPLKRHSLDVEFVSIVRSADISEQDVVRSSKFFEQRVEVYR